MWLYIEGIWDCVHQPWRCSGHFSPAIKLSKLLKQTKDAVRRWKHSIGNIFKRGQELNQQILLLQQEEEQNGALSIQDHMHLL